MWKKTNAEHEAGLRKNWPAWVTWALGLGRCHILLQGSLALFIQQYRSFQNRTGFKLLCYVETMLSKAMHKLSFKALKAVFGWCDIFLEALIFSSSSPKGTSPQQIDRMFLMLLKTFSSLNAPTPGSEILKWHQFFYTFSLRWCFECSKFITETRRDDSALCPHE